MTLYSAALFVHIIGVLLLSTTFTAEGIGLWWMRRGATAPGLLASLLVAAVCAVLGVAAGVLPHAPPGASRVSPAR